jgi:hypothetical protein
LYAIDINCVHRYFQLANLKLLSSHPTDDDLVLMSNDIPQSSFPLNDDSESSSDEDNVADHVPDPLLQECGALNSSGSDRGGRLSAMSGSVDMMDGRGPSPVSPTDEGSDWDDWSDEEEVRGFFAPWTDYPKHANPYQMTCQETYRKIFEK